MKLVLLLIFLLCLTGCGMDQSKYVCDPPTNPGEQSYCHHV